MDKIIIDLVFGDSGKGITTDYECSKNKIENTMVVRFSGGQQAGHNVRIGNKSHIHSNYGSGTLRGFPSYFTHHCTIYPVTMWREFSILTMKYVEPILYLHPLSLVTTPGNVAYNKLRELKVQHGSCGLGVGTTMNRNLTTGYKIYSIDLLNPKLLLKKIENVYWYYLNLIDKKDVEVFNDFYYDEFNFFEKAINEMTFNIKSYEFLNTFKNLIFEGSQGVLLDMNHGFFPNVTYANTTSKNAIEICKELNRKDIEINYVTRCYQTRHGNGWMSNNEKIN